MEHAPELDLKKTSEDIDKSIDHSARLQAYRDKFDSYLLAIDKETVNKRKLYYGNYLENLMEEINKDNNIGQENLQNNTKLLDYKQELLSSIAQCTEDISKAAKNKTKLSEITGQYPTKVDYSEVKNVFEMNTEELVNKTTANYVAIELIPWSENNKPEWTNDLKNLVRKVKLSDGKEGEEYKKKGKSFWKNLCWFNKPKDIKFDISETQQKYTKIFKEQKNGFVAGSLEKWTNDLQNNPPLQGFFSERCNNALQKIGISKKIETEKVTVACPGPTPGKKVSNTIHL